MPEFPSVDAAIDWLADSTNQGLDPAGEALLKTLKDWREDSEEGMVMLTLERFNALLAVNANPEEDEDTGEIETDEEMVSSPFAGRQLQPRQTTLGPTEWVVSISATVFYTVKVTATDAADASEQARQTINDGDQDHNGAPAINVKVIDIKPVEDE